MGYADIPGKTYGAHDGEMARLFKTAGWENVDAVHYGKDDDGLDCVWYGATASTYVWWDESADTWYFGQNDYGVDVYFYGATASAYMQWDASENKLIVAHNADTMSGDESGFTMTSTGTLTSGTSIYGLNLTVTPLGTGMSANAGYMKIAGGSSKHITGWNAVLELEYSCSGAQVPADTSCLQLNMDMDYTGSSTNSAYIMLRNYSSNASGILNFTRFYDEAIATTDPAHIVSTVSNNFETNCNAVIRFMIGTTPYWILCTSTAAA